MRMRAGYGARMCAEGGSQRLVAHAGEVQTGAVAACGTNILVMTGRSACGDAKVVVRSLVCGYQEGVLLASCMGSGWPARVSQAAVV